MLTSCSQTPQERDQDIYMHLRNKCGNDTGCYIKEALKDVAEGRPTIYVMGMLDNDFEPLYGEYLEKEKEINVIYGGCVVSAHVDIYTETTEKCIRAIHGGDFFEKCKEEVCKRHPGLGRCTVEP